MANVEFLKVDIYYVHKMNLHYIFIYLYVYYLVYRFIEIQQHFWNVNLEITRNIFGALLVWFI